MRCWNLEQRHFLAYDRKWPAYRKYNSMFSMQCVQCSHIVAVWCSWSRARAKDNIENRRYEELLARVPKFGHFFFLLRSVLLLRSFAFMSLSIALRASDCERLNFYISRRIFKLPTTHLWAPPQPNIQQQHTQRQMNFNQIHMVDRIQIEYIHIAYHSMKRKGKHVIFGSKTASAICRFRKFICIKEEKGIRERCN